MTEITEKMVEAAIAAFEQPGPSPWTRADRMRAALTAAFASRPSQGGEWVMVPKTETDEMCEAGLEALRENLGHSAVIMRDAAACYRAMVHAAPLSASPSPYGVGELVKAARALIGSRFSTYNARNGRQVSIEDDNGEKCWIVPFDEMFALETALSAITKDQSNG